MRATSGVLDSALRATFEEENLQIEAYPIEEIVMVKVLETIPDEEKVKEWEAFPLKKGSLGRYKGTVVKSAKSSRERIIQFTLLFQGVKLRSVGGDAISCSATENGVGQLFLPAHLSHCAHLHVPRPSVTDEPLCDPLGPASFWPFPWNGLH